MPPTTARHRDLRRQRPGGDSHRVLASLVVGRADRTWDKRPAELTWPTVLVLDDFGERELTAPQADDLMS